MDSGFFRNGVLLLALEASCEGAVGYACESEANLVPAGLIPVGTPRDRSVGVIKEDSALYSLAGGVGQPVVLDACVRALESSPSN